MYIHVYTYVYLCTCVAFSYTYLHVLFGVFKYLLFCLLLVNLLTNVMSPSIVVVIVTNNMTDIHIQALFGTSSRNSALSASSADVRS